MSQILLSPPDTGPDDMKAPQRAFEGGWIAPLGPEVDAFEEELANLAGRAHGVALASGTAALHLALLLNEVVAARLFAHGLCLPSGSSLSDEDRGRVIDGVRAAFGAS